MLNFPNNPVVGQQYSLGSKSWEWTGIAWKAISVADVLVARAETAAVTAEGHRNAAETAAQEAQAEVGALAASDGAGLVGTGSGDTVEAAINAQHLADYTALRAYTGKQKSVYITGYLVGAAPSGIAGPFVRDDNDTTSADNGGTIIVSGNGKRWKRVYDGVPLVSWFGAVGDGETNDDAPVKNTLLATGKAALQPGKRYKITSLTLTAGQVLCCVAGRATLVAASTSGTLITIAAADVVMDGVDLDGGTSATLYGANTAPKGAGVGLYISGEAGAVKRVSVKNSDIYGFTSDGVLLGRVAASAGSGKSVMFENVNAYRNFSSWNFGTLAEYCIATNCHGYQSTYGIQVFGGNNKFANCNFEENYCNGYVGGGTNNSHGGFLGCSFNHHTSNGRSLLVDGAQYGFEFVGCKFWYGNIEINNSSGIRICNGQIAAATITVSGGGLNWIHDNMLHGEITKTIAATAKLRWKNNFLMTDHGSTVKDGFYPDFYLKVRRTASTTWNTSSPNVITGFTAENAYLHSVANAGIFSGGSVHIKESGFYDLAMTVDVRAPAAAAAQIAVVKLRVMNGALSASIDELTCNVQIAAGDQNFRTVTLADSLFIPAGHYVIPYITAGDATNGVTVGAATITVSTRE